MNVSYGFITSARSRLRCPSPDRGLRTVRTGRFVRRDKVRDACKKKSPNSSA